MMTLTELRVLKQKELQKELESSKTDLYRLEIGLRTQHTKDTSLHRKQRAYIARIGTLLRELELEETIKNAAQVA